MVSREIYYSIHRTAAYVTVLQQPANLYHSAIPVIVEDAWSFGPSYYHCNEDNRPQKNKTSRGNDIEGSDSGKNIKRSPFACQVFGTSLPIKAIQRTEA